MTELIVDKDNCPIPVTKEVRTFGFYNAIKKTLRKYKGAQLNYDSEIENISIEITKAVLNVFQQEVDKIFTELREEIGVNNGK